MATAADILSVRREARLRQNEYFNQISGSRLQFVKQQPPLTVISVVKNGTTLSASTDYSFDGYRTVTLTSAAAETDVYAIDIGTVVTDSEISDIVDYSKDEVYGNFRLFYETVDLDTSTYTAELYKKLAAGYLIMKYWQGGSSQFTEDFWKYGRNLVDEAHARVSDVKNGEIQLTNASGRVNKTYGHFQYGVIDYAPGLVPSYIYSESADFADGETEDY